MADKIFAEPTAIDLENIINEWLDHMELSYVIFNYAICSSVDDNNYVYSVLIQYRKVSHR